MATTEAAQILEAVTLAARAASEAAQASKEANDQSRSQRSGFSEASKVVKCPSPFGCSNSAEDQSMWLDFSFAFKQWLYYAEPGYETDLTHIEEHLNSPIVYNQTPEGEKSKERSKRLYAILSGLLVHRPLKVLKQVVDSNGLEVWRQLSSLYSPRTKTRSLGILNALMAHPSFVRERTILEQIQGLERLADEHRRASGSDVNDDILLTTLVKCLPAQLRQHVQLTMDEASTFQLVKDKCIAYERLSMTWSKDKVYAELGAVTSYTTDSGGPTAMEVNQVSKGKGKSKGAKGKSGSKGKGKDKGKSNGSNYTRAKASHSRAAKGMQLQPPKVEERISQRMLMQTVTTTAVAMDIGSVIVGSFKLTRLLVRFDKWRMRIQRRGQHLAPAIIRLLSTQQVRHHTGLVEM